MTRPRDRTAPYVSALEHWEAVYGTKPLDSLSWVTPDGSPALAMIRAVAPQFDTRIVDIGCGASTLIDELLDAGYERVTAVDISATALAVVQARLGSRAGDVRWVRSDVTELRWEPGEVDVWHDRAAYHFLTAPDDRRRYRTALLEALAPEGAVILSGFSTDGPLHCSGLAVRQLSAARLRRDFPELQAQSVSELVHRTPGGNVQRFLVALLTRREAAG